MDRRKNPYAPGAGLQPPELAGRDKLLEDAMIDMDRVLDGRPTKGMMMLGLRGVGKTVLLNRLHRMAEEKGFRTAKVEAPEGGVLPQLLAPELRQVLYSLDLRAAAGQKVRQAASVLRNFVGAFKVKVGDIEVGIEQARGKADTGNLEQDLPDLLVAVSEAAHEGSVALGIFLDEGVPAASVRFFALRTQETCFFNQLRGTKSRVSPPRGRHHCALNTLALHVPGKA